MRIERTRSLPRASKKPTFCEKPPALSLAECRAMADAVEKSGSFFQMGFMRRFDPGYAAAKEKIEQGAIGRPVVFKSSSRDPFRPSLEYANPASSGGIMVDMGIHDFDLARWFMGDVDTVLAAGAVLAYPEMASIGDIDNAIATLVFADGRLGVIDLTRNGVYGYDISTELLGDAGTLRVGYLRETPLYTMTKNNVAHDTVPYFMERFERAYTLQLRNFAQNVLHDRVAAGRHQGWRRSASDCPGGDRRTSHGKPGEGRQYSVKTGVAAANREDSGSRRARVLTVSRRAWCS